MPDMSQASCSECNRPISDQFVMRVGDSILHEQCLRCFTCGDFLTESCFSKFGQFYCRHDFYTLFGPRCSGCQLVFSETEKVRKIDQSLFHGHCFKCKDCSKDLSEAEKVGCDQNGNLLCETDFLKTHCDDENSLGVNDCEDSVKKEENILGGEKGNEPTSEEEPDSNKEVIDDGKNKKKRGPKTTIKPHQLEVLKNCFDQNPKPTPKVFEELSKDTGLTKRVIQVWFQNKRSKRKRISKMQSIISMGQSFPSPMGPMGGYGGHWGDPGPDSHLMDDFPHPGSYLYPDSFPHPYRDEGGMQGAPFPPGYPPNPCFPSPPAQPSDYPGPPFSSAGPPIPQSPHGGPPIPSNFPSPVPMDPFSQD